MDFNDIFRIVGQVVCWGLAVLIGLVVLITIGSGIIAFASTGIGAIILAIVAWKIWKSYLDEE